jgi:hypothetical protein
MPGKPHETSFPEKTFTVKDGKSLNSERKDLNSASILTVSFIVSRWTASNMKLAVRRSHLSR